VCERKRRRPLDKSESHKLVSVFTSGCVRVLFFIFINNDYWMDGWDGMGWWGWLWVGWDGMALLLFVVDGWIDDCLFLRLCLCALSLLTCH